MTSIPNVTLYGALDFPQEPPKLALRVNGLDTVSQLFASSSPRAFAKGGPFPGLPNFYITESEPIEDIPGKAYDIRVRGEGLADGEDREEENEVVQTDEGWDQGPITWLTKDPSKFTRGQAHPRIPSLYILEAAKKKVCGLRNSDVGIWRVSADIKGIIPRDGLPKGRKRRITVGNQVVSSSAGMTLTGTTFTNEAGTYTGWADARSTALDSSRVQVADTFITWDAPPTDQLPGHLTPQNAPAVKDIFGTVWYSVSQLTWNWPWGWTLKSVSSEPLIYGLAGTPYLTTIVTEFVPRAVPK